MTFTIPMRGNEAPEPAPDAEGGEAPFTIPMRGNEALCGALYEHADDVYDPHEG